MSADDLVFEVIIKSITCRNMKSQSYPLVMEISGCTELTMYPKLTTICKLTYNKGKRIIFSQSSFSNIKTTFTVQSGCGDTTPKAACTFDFYEIYQANEDLTATIFDVEAGLDDVNGQRFGTLELSFQLFPYCDLQQIQQSKTIVKTASRSGSASRTLSRTESLRQSYTRPETAYTSRPDTARLYSTRPSTARTSTRSISTFAQRQPDPGAPTVPRLNIPNPPTSSRSRSESIYDRYMKQNAMWLGPHCSLHADDPSSSKSSARSKTSMSYVK
ncbi:hypothetical protein TVAG_003930 [Trichomonas vaginalis G3]|uniref:C2 NT-type domain-containing protein n=1 Tax=Trichomonas vaginalis (strain ATCC PRA-98 / G3) TaxID=412133 RepID=A2E5A7_TRIV3|nr:hypothetical protein TVAGG3_0476340 [Trichomonas vaginalis G3]EAY12187.1 hypothetical protein TVAG_003930 [Trichomonas vaginalis G3]KAI5515426.1 hypothetical protein TVAGG3_0476340 [Trichomonas vaginalis G3]|eukprot:XP_001324410.1 hypothetical protein [Trichomonas vaginalis G3]